MTLFDFINWLDMKYKQGICIVIQMILHKATKASYWKGQYNHNNKVKLSKQYILKSMAAPIPLNT